MLFNSDSDSSATEEKLVFGNADLVPISQLGRYASTKVRDDWKLTATVIKKGKIIRYKDDGQLFKIELLDEA